jgi:mono/diheme cytochrome c family protein
MDLRAHAGVTAALPRCRRIAAAFLLAATAAAAEETFTPAQVRLGAEIFERNCAPCHGPRMQDPESAFDLRKFPRNQHDRFVNSVTRGKNQMPPWGDMLKADEVEALWAYVTMGER